MFRNTILPAVVVLFLAALGAAQSDPDPNSTPPTLKSISGGKISKPGRNSLVNTQVFRIGRESIASAVISRLEFLPGEGANSIRIYLLQKSGRTFELPVMSVDDVSKSEMSLKFRLFDDTGFYGQPVEDGESAIYLAWRGLASNMLKINLGKSGNPIALPKYTSAALTGDGNSADYVGYLWSGDRTRFLEQATFGPSTITDNRLRRIGLRTWLAEQFDAPYPTNPYPVIRLMPTNPPSDCSQASSPSCYRERYTAVPLQQWFFKEAFYGDAQLRHKVAWALSQIWVTSAMTIQQSSHMIAYHKVLSTNAFGNYRDLMYQMTLNPAMGDYLDMVRSTKTAPNENYAREILQLFSIGLFRLNRDGTLMRDAGNNPIPTYDQATVNNLAKVFTGWGFCNNASCPNASPGILNFKDPMAIVPSNHDLTEKSLMTYPNAPNSVIAACADCASDQQTAQYATESLDRAIDNIFHHPNVPPFVSRILIQQFVTSDPSPAYVDRVAAAFENNGQNVRGDMKAVIRAILLDPEARGDVKTAPRYGKLREPVQLMTNLGRLFPARSWDGQSITDGGLSVPMTKLGQNAFYAPTVFNYYPPDYIVPGTTLNAPEFGLLNSTFAINRTNFLNTLIFDGFTANVTDSLRGTSLDQSEAIAIADSDPTGNSLVDYLNRRMLHGTMSTEHRTSVLTAVQAVPSTNSALRVKQALYLIAASSQYQVQR